MKFKFDVPTDFSEGINRLSSLLKFDLGEGGITVRAEKTTDRLGVCLKDKNAIIYYTQKCTFFREVGVLAETAKKESSFETSEELCFDAPGFMLDASRGAVATVKTVKRVLDYLAAMGYGENYLRLPLTPMEPQNEAKLLSLMKAEGIIE